MMNHWWTLIHTRVHVMQQKRRRWNLHLLIIQRKTNKFPTATTMLIVLILVETRRMHVCITIPKITLASSNIPKQQVTVPRHALLPRKIRRKNSSRVW